MDSVSNDTSSPFHASPFNYINTILAFLGVVLNSTVLLLCRRHTGEYSYMWFIGSLALADVMSCLQGMILSQTYLMVYGPVCVMVPTWGVVTQGAAITSHPLLALNRYAAVLRPHFYHIVFDNRYAIGGLLLLNWALPTCIMAVDFAQGCLGRDHMADTCFFNPHPQQLACILPKVVHFLSCYFISGVCYIRLFLALRQHQTLLTSSGVTSSTLPTDTQLLKLMALHALVPVCIHVPGLCVLVYPPFRLAYPPVIKLILMLFMMESCLNATLTLSIVRLFRDAVSTGLRSFYFGVLCRGRVEKTEVIPLGTAMNLQVPLGTPQSTLTNRSGHA